MRRGLKIALIAPVVAVFGVWALVNLGLNLGLPLLINDRPDRLTVGWDAVLMVRPGRLDIWGLELHGTGRTDRWSLTLPRASGDVDVWVLSERRFRATGLQAYGGTFQYALRDDPEPDRARDPRGPWSIELPEITSLDMTLLEVQGHAFAGDADLRGSLFLTDDVDADLSLELDGGTVSVRDRHLISAVTGSVGAVLRDLPRNGPIGRDALERMEADAHLVARADDLSGLGVYLAKSPWLTVEGTADVTVDARLEHGRFAPGTRAEARTDALILGFRAYRIVGDAVLTGEVTETEEGVRTNAAARYGKFTIREGAGAPMVAGSGFSMTATGGPVHLSEPLDDLYVVLDLPASDVQNLPAYTELLPAGSGVEVFGGAGTVTGHLEAHAGTGIGEGTMHIEAKDIALGVDALRMHTDLSVHVALPAGDLNKGSYVLGGSQVELTSFGFDDEPGRDWWATLTLARGVATVGAQTYLDADFSLDCDSSGPLVAVASQKAQMAGWIQNLLDVRDLTGHTALALRTDAIVVQDLLVTGGAAEVRMNLIRRGKVNEGAMYARLGPLAMGVGFAGANKTLHPLRARSWFDEQTLDL